MPNAYVIGLGKSGIAAAQLLHRQGWQVIVSDRGNSAALQEIQKTLGAEGIQVKLGHTLEPDAQDDAQAIQRIVVSPGVPWDSPALVKARELGIETIGETELAWQTLQHIPWVGITGTNGKTTTTALIAAIFQTAGLQAPACGNIGHAVCDLALETLLPRASRLAPPAPNWIIAELSSYQIEASPTIAPKIAVWTTFTPDHLSRHYTLENYYNIKARLLKQAQQQVINGDDPYLRQMADQWTDAYWTSVAGKNHLPGKPGRGAYIENGWVLFQDEAIVPVSDLRMVGAHNQQNLLMAVLVAQLAGIETAAIAEAVRTFPGVPHRLEHICTWNGIDFINDSKATNYDAAQVGLSSVAAPVILIAGGDAKEGDDASWIATIHAKAAKVLLIGDAAPKFAQRLQESGYTNTEIVETMDRAVVRASELGQAVSAKVVLLSPACASFDQYTNFEQRGDHFRQLCQEMLQ